MHIENTPHMNNINQNATKLKYLLSALRLGLHLRLLRQQRVVGRLGVDEGLVALLLLREVVVHVPHFDLDGGDERRFQSPVRHQARDQQVRHEPPSLDGFKSRLMVI